MVYGFHPSPFGDTLILATGFQTTRFLSAIDVVGRGGRKLDEAWSDGEGGSESGVGP